MKTYIVACLILLGSAASAQSLNDARKEFDNYEYQNAFNIYNELNLNGELSNDDLKRFAYSGFAVGKYSEILSPVESILAQYPVEPYFYFIHGEICLDMGKYESAKDSYEKYSKLDSEVDVSVKIQTCDEKPGWSEEEHLENLAMPDNSSKADIAGRIYEQGTVVFHEVGTDSTGSIIESSKVDYSELVMSKPFLVSNNVKTKIQFEQAFDFASITSFEILRDQNQVIFSVAEPTRKALFLKAPHLYIGDWVNNELAVKNAEPWVYSGFEDSTACAHATVDGSGKRIVFTKIGDKTELADLYMTNLVNGKWTAPEPLTELNTTFDEMFPAFHGDSILLFSSNGRPGYGRLDIYQYDFTSGQVEHFKSPVNSDMDDFNLYYIRNIDSAYYTSNRSGGAGDDDRYFVKFRESLKETIDSDSSDYYSFINNWVDQKIYFDYDKFDIKKDVKLLDEIILFLKENENASILLEAHTDKRGDNKYNISLSFKRARTVKNELVSLGVRPIQIMITTLGESKPLVDCVDCTEDMHAENRVVILKLKTK